MRPQTYTAWFTDYPETHEQAGETVEVVPRALLDEARAHAEALATALEAIAGSGIVTPANQSRALAALRDQARGFRQQGKKAA